MTTSTKSQQSKKGPDYYAHAVMPDGRQTRIGSSIGVVFTHHSGNGFNIILDAIPAPNLDGQYVISCFKADPK